MEKCILLVIFLLLIGARLLEERSGSEHIELNHNDSWRNWYFTGDISLFEPMRLSKVSTGIEQLNLINKQAGGRGFRGPPPAP